VTRVEAAQARALFPPLAEGLDGIHITGGARVDGRLLCRGLLEAVDRLGGTVVTGTATLVPRAQRPGVVVDGHEQGADAIVIAGGAWSRGVLAPLGVRVELEPQRGQIVHLRLDGVDTADWPTISPIDVRAMGWDAVQVGNCGPPIETAEGWLVLTHGVGAMRTYSIGALLLDLDDPTIG